MKNIRSFSLIFACFRLFPLISAEGFFFIFSSATGRWPGFGSGRPAVGAWPARQRYQSRANGALSHQPGAKHNRQSPIGNRHFPQCSPLFYQFTPAHNSRLSSAHER
jgi:hypothetical protein